MQRRALKSKDARRIKEQFSDICIDSAIRQHYAEKEYQRGLKVRAFEARCLRELVESFEKSFNQPEHADFYGEAKKRVVAIWVKNKYTQNFVGALQQLQCIAVRHPSCKEVFERWCTRQRMKHEYALRWAEKNNYEEATEV